MQKKEDLRNYKTEKALMEALYDLICQKGFEDITVTELCQKTNIRKATFYRHFSDKRDLFSFMIKNIKFKYLEQNKNSENDPVTYFSKGFEYLLGFLDDNELFIKKILNSSSYWELSSIWSEQIRLDIENYFEKKMKDYNINKNLLISACTGAVMYSAEEYVRTEEKPEKESILAELREIVRRLLKL